MPNVCANITKPWKKALDKDIISQNKNWDNYVPIISS